MAALQGPDLERWQRTWIPFRAENFGKHQVKLAIQVTGSWYDAVNTTPESDVADTLRKLTSNVQALLVAIAREDLGPEALKELVAVIEAEGKRQLQSR